MTGLYVICSKRPQKQLSMRRNGYQEYFDGHSYAYAREAISPDTLGVSEGERVRMLPQWVQDVGSVSGDPEASFFFVEMKNRESAEQAIERGRSLPVSKRSGLLLLPDRERRSAFGE
ncbi:hypothetical protein [Paenirhodobacter populi]|uniref:Uncharacterized protein n=1 Tax=Paenirhodobacter populi TaxID=2306993 RepID=A0A443IK41_9RHOB|nr:hypothetical protein [Sinirhodobacter populi]RWR04715.1 hypothetical protein D2T33_20850 [Sinirhodobacter populi]